MHRRTLGMMGVFVLVMGLAAAPGHGQTNARGAARQRTPGAQPSQARGTAWRFAQADPAAGPPQTDDTIVRAYAFPADRLKEAAAELSAEFSDKGMTKFAVDDRTSQVLVVAPPAVHDQISTWVARQAARTAPRPLESRVATPRTGTAANPIRFAPEVWPRLAASLEKIWRVSLAQPSQQIGDLASYQVKFQRGGEVALEIDGKQGTLVVHGAEPFAGQAARLIEALLAAPNENGNRTAVVPVVKSPPEKLRMALAAYQTGAPPADGERAAAVQRIDRPGALANSPLARLFRQQQDQTDEEEAEGDQSDEQQEEQPPAEEEGTMQQPGQIQLPGQLPPGAEQELAALLGQVRIEYIEGMDAIIVTGRDQDVQRVLQIIEEIERIAAETVPIIEIYPLAHANSQALSTMVTTLYDQMLAPRQGRVSITPLVKPNSLLLIGRQESVDSARNLIKLLDQPVDPETQFRVFRLKHASATEAQALIEEFYQQRGEAGQAAGQAAAGAGAGLGPRVLATADFRTNSLVVQASPRDLAEVAALIQQMDDPTSDAQAVLRVFPLQYTLAEELAETLRQAITTQTTTQTRGGQQQQQFQGGQFGQGNQGGGQQTTQGASGARSQQQRSLVLSFTTVDPVGQYQSGILTDVRITAEPRANKVLVSAPAESMKLIEALIQQLDQPPAAAAQVKVFTLERGDASSLAELLQNLFGQAGGTTGARGGQAGQQRLVVAEGEGGVIPLRFSVDTRTNSIIVAGSEGDLRVVEAILYNLDESDIRQTETRVFRLNNSPAESVATAVNEYLTSQREVQQIAPDAVSPFEQVEREVVVVPEIVTNSLIVSATPRYFKDIAELIDELDARPPMVMIQVLIGEVSLNNTDEFGVELGLQDSLLFDRSLLEQITNITQSTQTSTPAGVVTDTRTVLQTATLTPGFIFNTPTVANAVSSSALRNSNKVGGQALSSLSVGRQNNELGFGGLVLSASSESVSLLIRALQESRRLDVLSRPQIMTLDNQLAYVQVGERVPLVNGVTINTTGQTNNVTLEEVGLIMTVTPRISPDGQVVMEIDAQKSALGPEAEGVPISVSATGEVVRQPRIDITRATTVVMAGSGQTVVLGGLITNRKAQVHRRVPVLASIPVVGNLFRYDSVANERTEMLIILTPHIVRNKEDAELVKQVEAARMSWCLADVRKVHGNAGLRGREDEWQDGEVVTVYPDLNPDGTPAMMPESTAPQQGDPTLAPPNLSPPNATPPGNAPPAINAPVLRPPGGAAPTPGMQPQAAPNPPRPLPNGNSQQAMAPPRQLPPVQPAAYVAQ